ncbi:putative bifunctional diguanylate cyclase/phosphodiesterase [Pelagibacterium limicola]|uniref:putative bifunctional diguanylate cyclase/phosphodiesterase n=1 Tax=Pelagibacterium limicola TaxID=2791022 RepID=UPI0018AF78A7|nr:EAL domain-containing protein [Pelagibacterium limicola]
MPSAIYHSAHFAQRVALPALTSVALLAALVGMLLIWAGREADEVSVARQTALANVVVGKLRETIAHDQESVTVWDDAVLRVQEEDATEWIEYNLGRWMHTYFGHDGAYVLDPADHLIYQYSVDESASYLDTERRAAPLVADLRQRLREGDDTGLSDRILSQGASDITVVSGRPALVSVKPIVSDTGDIEQVTGAEYLHIAVRFLDGDFLDTLAGDYLFEAVRFGWDEPVSDSDVALPLRANAGEPVGYLIWKPYRPGAEVIAKVGPVATVVAAAVFSLILGLLFVLNLRSRKLAERDARMRHLAHHDPLTDLPNRALFDERLETALKERSPGSAVAVLYLDLDHFKQVNDTLGHPIGDAVIVEFTARLGTLIGPGDTLARLGGDEFTIVMPALATEEAVTYLSDRIIDAVRHPFNIEGQQVFVGVTIGIALAPRDGQTRTDLCRKADIALYHAKGAGRGRYAIFGPEMDAMLQARREMERDLRLALQSNDQLEVHYQPLVSAASQKMIGVEALLRWRHPISGWLPPDQFIPIAEESGLIEAVGDFVLREVCKAARRWPNLSIAMNVSAIELRNPAFAAKVAARVLEAGVDPGRLELELTESALTDVHGIADQNIRALRTLGVRIALDDFGTGFSSLSRLQTLELDRIKIDRSFIDGVGRTNGDEAIVHAIVEMARARGLKTTAEGVETLEQSSKLMVIGCDELQGFLYSRAVPASGIDALLAEGPARDAKASGVELQNPTGLSLAPGGAV